MAFRGLVVPLAALTVVLTMCASPARGSADEFVVRDSHIRSVHALDDTLVYSRFERRGGQRKWTWRRLVGGRVLPARGVPPDARVGAIGRDRAGRVVLTMGVSQRRNGGQSADDWWIYDVARDRARRLRGLRRGGCEPLAVSVWRSRLAYAAWCERQAGSAVFLREGDRTRRLARTRGERAHQVVLRGDTLVALLGTNGDQDAVVWRLLEDGKVCPTRIDDSFLPLEVWGYAGIWLAGDTLMWWAMTQSGRLSGTLVGTRLGNCGPPGPTGTFALTTWPRRVAARTIDGRWLYYTDRDGIRRRRLAARPEVDPPPNDDFEHAEPLIGDPPISRRTTIGNATLQPGEPPLRVSSSGTIWYAFQPITSHRVAIAASWPYGVFEGTHLRSLTQVGEPSSEGTQSFQSVAGRTYWIALGCWGFSCFAESFLSITPFDSATTTTAFSAGRP